MNSIPHTNKQDVFHIHKRFQDDKSRKLNLIKNTEDSKVYVDTEKHDEVLSVNVLCGEFLLFCC